MRANALSGPRWIRVRLKPKRAAKRRSERRLQQRRLLLFGRRRLRAGRLETEDRLLRGLRGAAFDTIG